MDDEILIEKVRQYEELYNMAHKKYSDNQHKDVILLLLFSSSSSKIKAIIASCFLLNLGMIDIKNLTI